MSSRSPEISSRFAIFGFNVMWRTCVVGAVLLLSMVYGHTASAAEPSDSPQSGATAAPLGWSTAVADFDADGIPDTANAESLQTHGGGGYRLNIQLSGGSVQRLTFVSGQGAVDVTAVDIDNDRDLDIVVRPILGSDVVGVWLNDGAGQFTRGSPEVPVPPRTTLQAATLTSGIPALVLGTVSRLRMSHLAPRGPTLVIADPHRLTLRESNVRPTTAFSCTAPSRAPPVSPVNFRV